MDINKRDMLTIAVLCTVFFSIAVSNLGSTQIPVSTWQTHGNKAFYVDLGTTQNVGTIYLLVKNGSTIVQVYTGSHGNWNFQGSLNITYPYAYYKWNKTTINSNTRYVRFDFEQASVEIAELAVLSQDNQKLPIVAVNSEGASDANLQRLVDEQGKVQVPLTYMSETFFDEVYYVRTAENYLHLQHPYEWTHPPLGKFIIASGIVIFGFSPFGWRIMGAVFAMLMIPLIYVLGKKLFGTWIGAFASALLLTFDFMHFTMARMATVDTYVVFFSLTSQLFFFIYLANLFKEGWKTSVLPLFLSFLFFALGFSTKWLVLYGFIGMLVILFALRLKDVRRLAGSLSKKLNAILDHPFYLLPSFLLIAVCIYFLTYIPDMLAGRSFLDVLGLQGSMYIYHSTLVATHPFSSAWWSWPLMLKPVWLYGSSLPLNMKSTITLLGNPAIWWVGFASIIGATATAAAALRSRFRKNATKQTAVVEGAVGGFDLAAVFIAVVFFFQWLPYIIISRITFIYHFYVSVPLLCLASAYFISKYWSNRWVKVAAVAFFAVVVLLFALFYPVISGTPASTGQIDSLKWFYSWVF
ncbi:phospholipid carrier-dependent glycosyltransferase [Candidatus Bathyarchaeota archaeon A05DMB-2]|jgi:dolichyl-phosphate-mannose--protein O-mannosyl transferase|nr:phospholipid carrier-dependent glycosyltransferase [Candidatus Bathyarchaeota archaeon A05DMB-2]